ncbi:MAG: DUF4406 domain-containing protein [Planctomycetaceae bacterium]|nr:DUF4406 domain-containing protein [Planctomycetaceae bacterium]
MKTIYIAGPMRGFKHYNFPAFDDAKEELEAKGWKVISPADLDRDRGFDPTTLPDDHDWSSVDGLKHFKLEDAITEDVTAIRASDAIFMLPGWRQSTGATAVYHLAKWAGKEIHEAEPSQLPTDAIARKGIPVVTGCLHYFPAALAEVAMLSKAGNDQHNPRQLLHWDRTKSADHVDCLGRHLLQIDERDTDGQLHAAKVAWRALAHLQVMLEQGA